LRELLAIFERKQLAGNSRQSKRKTLDKLEATVNFIENLVKEGTPSRNVRLVCRFVDSYLKDNGITFHTFSDAIKKKDSEAFVIKVKAGLLNKKAFHVTQAGSIV